MADSTVGTFGGGEPEVSDSLRTFGAVVQALREHAGLSREEFAELVRFSKHTVASIEQGRRMPDPVFVERAEEVLGNTGALRKAAAHLARQPGLAAWFRQWARLEAVAISLYTYECRVVPGLLQTEAYSRAVSLSVPPIPDEEELNERIAARLARQELLSTRRKPMCAFSFIVEQSVLERQTGGEEVTRELLDHLLDMIDRHWNVEVQIMPLRQPVHAGLDGPLQLLETPENQWFAYSEGQNNGRLISDSKEISLLHHRYAKLRSQALTPEDSRGLLKRMRGSL
ncbi:helix-turn-helix transcriptional regulator [Streptomyces turgidiscabies]|uniref:Toxin-antitoxin system, antitoxin component, Xre family n=1 Tax=Streptomyces turgidiscabies (strain Car8) TaxID=698760 RepID=L7FG74_STRT8|nr:helix-turn-helix transcriptional regulator [Streptomyces turgidiscabies]ELP70056.1 toxin-antitoxin system, antitoxin component, Xre family [Streptomyces turgidiscabies Car8]MDX3494172.1 helix-turn-helix transcriptional regulator [Streptomyces turgidiscabies]